MFRLVVPVRSILFSYFCFPCVFISLSFLFSSVLSGCVSPACYLDLWSVGDVLFINSLLLH